MNQEEYVANMNSKGLNGQEILNTVMELAEKYNQEHGN
jgi:hypothetical protein